MENLITVEVTIKNQEIHHISVPDNFSIHIFDYSKKWSKEITEPDSKGVQCKQQIWAKTSKTSEKVCISISEGVIQRLQLPENTKVTVKTYLKNNTGPEIKHYVKLRKKA